MRLWIGLLEVGEESRVGEVLETGRVVCHDIVRSWEVVRHVAVSMEALVVRCKATESGCGPRAVYSSFAVAGHSRCVVTEGFHSGVARRPGPDHEVALRQDPGLLQVAVGDGAGWVVSGHQSVTDVGWEGMAPHVTAAMSSVEDSTHAWFRSVGGSQSAGIFSDQLCQVSRPFNEAGCQSPEGVDAVSHELSDPHPVRAGLVLGPLEGTEQARRSWDGGSYKAELAKDAAPFLRAHSLHRRKVLEDLG